MLVLAGCPSGADLTGDVADDDAGDREADALPDEASDESTFEVDCGIEVADDAGASTTCPIVDPASLGECTMPLGIVFDGMSCIPVSGCGCTAPSCRAFASLAECARTCAEAGRCNLAMIPLDDYPYVCTADFCDSISFCPTDDVATLQEALRTLYPSLRCGDDVYPSYCTTGLPCEVFGGYSRPEILASFCPVTLLPGIEHADCFIAF